MIGTVKPFLVLCDEDGTYETYVTEEEAREYIKTRIAKADEDDYPKGMQLLKVIATVEEDFENGLTLKESKDAETKNPA